jgi:hypothetical protein
LVGFKHKFERRLTLYRTTRRGKIRVEQTKKNNGDERCHQRAEDLEKLRVAFEKNEREEKAIYSKTKEQIPNGTICEIRN